MAWIELKCDKCGKRKFQESSLCICEISSGEYCELLNPCACGGEFWIIDCDGNAVSKPDSVQKVSLTRRNSSLEKLSA
jgi:hypothetical protein